ncbi:MAG: Rne/Rng family ribonuclease [Cyanobacteria bacterium P01_D01_bin.105]
MSKQIVIAEQHRVAAVFEEDQIQEIIVATGSHQVGDIYIGTVENILTSIDACFVNIGDKDKNGFMHVSDLGPLKLKRTAGPITELLAPRQKVLVQIMKEPTGNKGPRLTGKVTLPGRYLVLMPYGKGVNLSRRIRNETERNRLRALGILIKPSGTGLLIRTEAEGVSEDAIIEDLEALQKRWESIQQEAMNTRPPSLLNRDDDFIQKVLRDVYSDNVNRIVTDTESGFERTKRHLAGWSDGRIPAGILIDHHREPTQILEYFRVNAAIREALKPRVDLPSGGYIIIEPTEALTVVDVNSGSFTRSATSRETVLWTNCEAAVEIARQLKLRNIAGVIVVDFIDMESRRDQLQVLEQFGMSLRSDKSRPQISQLSELGLVELTRKRQGQNIYELFGQACPTCGGLGHLAHLPGEAPDHTESLTAFASRSQGFSSPAQSYSSRPSAKASRDNRAAVSLDPQSELQELDLVNHPSYQDKNGRSSRRRRRRSDNSSRGSRSGSSSSVPTLKDASDERPSNQRRGRAERAEKANLDSSEDRFDSQSEKVVANGELSSRNKRTRNNRRKSEDPPELIAVEMPIDVQRIYATMGISPLAYTDQPVANPQNVEVSVVLPGEAEAFLTEARAKVLSEGANKRVIQSSSSVEQKGGKSAELAVDSSDRNDSDSDDSELKERPASGAYEDNSETDADKSDRPIRRRRRSNRAGSADKSDERSKKATLPVKTERDLTQLPQEVGNGTGPQTNESTDDEMESAEKVVVRRRRRRRSSASE